MPSALVVGVNTYVTLAEADAYLDDSVSTTDWATLDEDTRVRALLSAFRLLERQVWQGDRTDEAQEADHPRTGLVTCDGIPVPEDEVAEDIESAQIELAFAITADPELETKANQGSNVRRVSAGSATVEFFNSTDGSGGFVADRFPANVMELIKCFLEGYGASSADSEAFGTGCPSVFPSCCDSSEAQGFERTQPL